LLLSSDPADAAAAGGAYLKLAGGTLTGALTLAADPSLALGAATKQYTDTKDALRLALAGGTMTGPLTLAADPSAALQPATKQYVDAKPSGATVLATAPSSPVPGQLWWDSVGGQLYVYYNDGTSQQWVPASTVPGNTAAANNVGRNLIHNPLFNIAQRGVGPFTTAGYTLDRWYAAQGADAISLTQGTLASDPQIGDEAVKSYLRNAFTGNAGAGGVVTVYQPIEDVRRLAGKTITVSFWAVATPALKLGISLDQYFGTGGSPSSPIQGAGQSVTLSTSWARYTLTFALPSAAGKTLGTNNDSMTSVFFWGSSGSSNAVRAGNIGVQSGVISITGVQLEVGGVATPLEKPDPRYDLANCQRFYQQHLQVLMNGYNAATVGIYGDYFLPVTMRAAPTVTFANVSYANAFALVSTASRPSNIVNSVQMSTTGSGWGMADILLSADL
jgi:hypothetical protein